MALNAYELIEAGLGPLTIATDVLKPGGYLRFLPAAKAAVARPFAGSPEPRPRSLASASRLLAEEALKRPEYRKGFKKSEFAHR